MKRTMIAVLAALCLLTISMGMAPSAGGLPAAASPAAGAPAANGSVASVFSEDFEWAFPGNSWIAGDVGSGSGDDYWGAAWSAESAQVHGGQWSGWCAEEGTNSPNMDQPNFLIRAYDYNMDAFMHQAWGRAVDMSSSDLAYLDFWAWSDTEPNADYLSLEWYDEGSGTWVNTGADQRITGTSGWTRYYWKTPYRYMTGGALFGFLFHSDFSETGEGVYVDDINLMQADITVGPDSYASANVAQRGDSFTLNYHIHNPAPFPVQCGLGAWLAGISAPVGCADAAHDTVVTIPSGYSWQTRTFEVPSGIPPEFGALDGSYRIVFEIWSGMPKDTADGNRFWGYSEAADTLTVDSTPPPAPALISPANGARIEDDTPAFDWSDVTDPMDVYYTLEVDDDAGFSSPASSFVHSTSQQTAASAMADGRYYWRVKAEDRLGNSSPFSAPWYFDLGPAPASPPAVATAAATGIETASATLNGDLSSLGTASPVQVSFEWGATQAYDNATPRQALTSPATFSAGLSGLAAGATYHFRARADGDGGPVFGSDATFTTAAAPVTPPPAQPLETPPAVTTADAGSVTGSSAHLNGSLDSMGTAAAVSVSFAWGTVQGGPYPNETAGSAQAGPGAFGFDLSGLAAGTTFYYQARAAGDGASFGVEKSFTTVGAAAGPPVIAGIVAGHGRAGDDLTVIITGSNLAGATAVDFGEGIAVSELQVASDTRMTARIVIAGDAAAGKRDVTVTAPSGTGASPGGFEVSAAGSRVHLWVYLVAAAGGLAGLGALASLAVWLRRRPAKTAS